MRQPDPAQHALVERLTLDAANTGEQLISAVRALFCVLVLGRFLLIDRAPQTARIEGPVLALAIAGSLYALAMARKKRFRGAGLVLSSLADGAVCFLLLLATVLWPGEVYFGLLRMPEIAAVLPVILVSALRLSPAAALAASLAGALSFAMLVGTDLVLHGPRLTYRASEIAMEAILIVSVSIATWATARTAQRLVRRAGHESAQLVRARHHLDALLREHHDVRTVLSTARINLQLAQASDPCEGPLAAIGAALDELSGFIESVKGQTFAELATLDGLQPCNLERAVHVAAQVIRHRFPAVALEISVPTVRVAIVGGEPSLSQVIFNLLGNACEGDGNHAACHIQVHAQPSGKRLRLQVHDDGPGFLTALLGAPLQALPSTKRCGGGIGLKLVSSLIESSGGRLELGNRRDGGACVTLDLALVP
jgi:signal transduction histidine kinase